MKKSAVWTLPPGYSRQKEINLPENRSAVKAMAVMQLLLAAAMIGLGIWKHPLAPAFSMGSGRSIAAVLLMGLGSVVYLLAHEWVHGVFIRLFTGRSAAFGLELKKGMAYAYSEAYFAKSPYLIIALAPLVVWTVILGLLLRDVPESWFWYLYVIQIVNITGCSGDLYVAWLTLFMPKETLILDNGMKMEFFW